MINPGKLATGVTTMVEVRRVRNRGENLFFTTPVIQEEEPKQVVLSKEETESEESQNRLAREKNQNS